MANTLIQILRSGISGRVPPDLDHGVLAINYHDGKLFYKNSANNITSFKNSNSFSTINANGSYLHAQVEDTLGIQSENIDISISGNDIILNVKTTNSINSDSTIAASANAVHTINSIITEHKLNESVHQKIITINNAVNITMADSFSSIDYRTCEYTIQGKANNTIHVGKVILTHDDTDLYFTEPYELLTANNRLWSFGAFFNNDIVEVYLTTASAVNFKISRNIIPS